MWGSKFGSCTDGGGYPHTNSVKLSHSGSEKNNHNKIKNSASYIQSFSTFCFILHYIHAIQLGFSANEFSTFLLHAQNTFSGNMFFFQHFFYMKFSPLVIQWKLYLSFILAPAITRLLYGQWNPNNFVFSVNACAQSANSCGFHSGKWIFYPAKPLWVSAKASVV